MADECFICGSTKNLHPIISPTTGKVAWFECVRHCPPNAKRKEKKRERRDEKIVKGAKRKGPSKK